MLRKLEHNLPLTFDRKCIGQVIIINCGTLEIYMTVYIRKGVVLQEVGFLQEVTNHSWLSSTHFSAQQVTRCSYVAKEMICRSNLQVTMTNTIHK